MKHPLQKPLLYLLTSSCQKTPSFSDARESDLFRERSRLFELEFWNKKNSLTRADGGRWSSLYDDRYHSDESFWNTPLLRGALRLSRMRFVSFLKRFFSRVASRKLITVGVFFFFSLSFFPNFTKTSQFRRRQTHFARAKAKDGRRKRPPTKVLYSRSLMIKHDNNNGDKNNENARSSALPYLAVCTKKVVLNLCALSAEKHVGPSFGKTKKTNEFYYLGRQTLLLNKTAFFSSSWKKEQQKKEAKNGRKQRN